MNAKDLKVGFPLYYITSTQLKFDNVIIHNIEKINIGNYSAYRTTLVEHKHYGYQYVGFTDIKLDDIVYLTKGEYNRRMTETESAPGITFYEENTRFWDHNKEAFMKIKRDAFKYRLRKLFNKIVYGKDLR